jgi:hypothetical protein
MLRGICGGFFSAARLSWGEYPQSGLFEKADEFGCPRRPTGVGVAAKGGRVGLRRSVSEIVTPLGKRPALPPTLHFQQRVWGIGAAVSGGARPSPLLGSRHHTGAHLPRVATLGHMVGNVNYDQREAI